MLIDFDSQSNIYLKEQQERLDEIARESIIYFCEKIEGLGYGINEKMLYDMCSRIEKKIFSVTFKSE